MYRDFRLELSSCIEQWLEFLQNVMTECGAAPCWARIPLNYLQYMPTQIFTEISGIDNEELDVCFLLKTF